MEYVECFYVLMFLPYTLQESIHNTDNLSYCIPDILLYDIYRYNKIS